MEVRDAIETRRALRSLDPVEIPDETVRELVEAARLSASCFNNQPWRFVFVRRPDVLARMFKTLPDGNRWAIAASRPTVFSTSRIRLEEAPSPLRFRYSRMVISMAFGRSRTMMC